VQAKHTQDKINQLKNTEFGKKVLDKLDEEEIAKMDADEIMAKQMEELEREKKELQVIPGLFSNPAFVFQGCFLSRRSFSGVVL
jgi:hypothetical protein